MMSSDKQIWDKTIESSHKLLDLRLKQVWDYRDLVYLFVKRDFITYYKQTIFGPLWYLFQPILSTVMYILIFGQLAQIGTDEIPQTLFYFSGTMLWTYFSSSLVKTSNTFIENKTIFGKVYFPRLTVPIASAISLIMKLLIQFALFVLVYIFYLFKGANIQPSPRMLLFPVIVLWIGLLATGLGMIISAITTKYRDLVMVLEYFVSLWMYATPVVYPLSEVPEKLRILFYINPISAPIEMFRICFFGAGYVPALCVVSSITCTILFLFVGLILFNRNERTFVDVI